MVPNKIYFDMDGVLADFDRGIIELCGLEPLDQEKDNATGKDDEMWNAIREVPHFYDKLEIIDGSKELFDYLIGKYKDKVEILTGIPKEKRGILTAGEDKINWVRRLLSKNIVINVVHREDKLNYCTGKNCVLIDDYSKNIKEWNEQGGTGILFRDAKQALRDFEELYD